MISKIDLLFVMLLFLSEILVFIERIISLDFLKISKMTTNFLTLGVSKNR
jgi:hypothetical protein